MMVPGLTAYPGACGMRAAGAVSAADRSSRSSSKAVAKILIVEDDFLAASEMEAVLMDAGLEIAGIADRAEEAVRLAKAGAPALAIMDIRLIGHANGVDAALEMFRQTGVRCISRPPTTMRAYAPARKQPVRLVGCPSLSRRMPSSPW